MLRIMPPIALLIVFLFSAAVFAAPSPIIPAKVTASSILPSSKDGSYAAENILSSNLSTAWVEGTQSNGVGEWLEFAFNETQQFNSIRICNGYQKSRGIYNNNARAKTLALVFANGESQRVNLNDTMGCFDYPLSGESDRIKLVVEAIYPGAKWQDLAISHIQFLGVATASTQSPQGSASKDSPGPHISPRNPLKSSFDPYTPPAVDSLEYDTWRRQFDDLMSGSLWELTDQERQRLSKVRNEVDEAERVKRLNAARSSYDSDIAFTKSCYYETFPASEGYPTIGEAFDKFFKRPRWTVKTDEAGYNTVIFTGIYNSVGGPAKFSAQFPRNTFLKDKNTFTYIPVQINGQGMSSAQDAQIISQVFLSE